MKIFIWVWVIVSYIIVYATSDLMGKLYLSLIPLIFAGAALGGSYKVRQEIGPRIIVGLCLAHFIVLMILVKIIYP